MKLTMSHQISLQVKLAWTCLNLFPCFLIGSIKHQRLIFQPNQGNNVLNSSIVLPGDHSPHSLVSSFSLLHAFISVNHCQKHFEIYRKAEVAQQVFYPLSDTTFYFVFWIYYLKSLSVFSVYVGEKESGCR